MLMVAGMEDWRSLKLRSCKSFTTRFDILVIFSYHCSGRFFYANFFRGFIGNKYGE